MAHRPANTIEAFENALAMGATGLETDAWPTSDGHAALSHSAFVRPKFIPRKISSLGRHELPTSVPTLESLYREVGCDFELSIDIKSVEAASNAISAATQFGSGAVERLWLCHADLRLLRSWRMAAPGVRLVDSTRRFLVREGFPKRARRLRALGIDAVNLHIKDWDAGAVELFHEHNVLAFGWGANAPGQIREAAKIGLDGVYGDWVDRLVSELGG